jgi:hypothetical protein
MGAVGNCAARAPVMGGQFAVWGGLFACCDCSLTAIRQKVSLQFFSGNIHLNDSRSQEAIHAHIHMIYYTYHGTFIGRSMELHHFGGSYGRYPRCSCRTQGDGFGSSRRGSIVGIN